ncbi:MAG: glycosyltransferase family 4 protein [Deltaproteobacteria bacterium]|nr:glycosyltransferase family 4 protein [Deltaproteobacteria bacterium]
MRVIIVGTRGFPNVQGGLEKHCECLSVNLVTLGCDVTVFTRKPYVDVSLKNFQGVKLVALPAFRHKLFENFFHTLLCIFVSLKYKKDIIHFQAIGSALLVPLARLFGMKVVLTSHGSNYQHLKWGRFAKLVLKLSEFLGVTFTNKVIAISRTIADEIKEKYNRDAAVIPNGVYIPRVTGDKNILNKYGLQEKKYILAVGRFVPEKGFHDLIEAFNRVSLNDLKLVIVGDADHKDAYSMRLKEIGLKNKDIIMPGFLRGEVLQGLYSHAVLFVLPSYYEGFPIALLEALGSGLSCLASDIPGNRNIDLAGERFFTPGDSGMLSELLKEFSQKPLGEEVKKEQINTLAAKFDWENIARQTIVVYSKAVS